MLEERRNTHFFRFLQRGIFDTYMSPMVFTNKFKASSVCRCWILLLRLDAIISCTIVFQSALKKFICSNTVSEGFMTFGSDLSTILREEFTWIIL